MSHSHNLRNKMLVQTANNVLKEEHEWSVDLQRYLASQSRDMLGYEKNFNRNCKQIGSVIKRKRLFSQMSDSSVSNHNKNSNNSHSSSEKISLNDIEGDASGLDRPRRHSSRLQSKRGTKTSNSESNESSDVHAPSAKRRRISKATTDNSDAESSRLDIISELDDIEDETDFSELFTKLFGAFGACDDMIEEKYLILEDCLDSVDVFLQTLDMSLLNLKKQIRKTFPTFPSSHISPEYHLLSLEEQARINRLLRRYPTARQSELDLMQNTTDESVFYIKHLHASSTPTINSMTQHSHQNTQNTYQRPSAMESHKNKNKNISIFDPNAYDTDLLLGDASDSEQDEESAEAEADTLHLKDPEDAVVTVTTGGTRNKPNESKSLNKSKSDGKNAAADITNNNDVDEVKVRRRSSRIANLTTRKIDENTDAIGSDAMKSVEKNGISSKSKKKRDKSKKSNKKKKGSRAKTSKSSKTSKTKRKEKSVSLRGKEYVSKHGSGRRRDRKAKDAKNSKNAKKEGNNKKKGAANAKEKKTVWCLCRKKSNGKMVECSNYAENKCKYGWYHYSCQNLNKKPKGTWYCTLCRLLPNTPHVPKK